MNTNNKDYQYDNVNGIVFSEERCKEFFNKLNTETQEDITQIMDTYTKIDKVLDIEDSDKRNELETELRNKIYNLSCKFIDLDDLERVRAESVLENLTKNFDNNNKSYISFVLNQSKDKALKILEG